MANSKYPKTGKPLDPDSYLYRSAYNSGNLADSKEPVGIDSLLQILEEEGYGYQDPYKYTVPNFPRRTSESVSPSGGTPSGGTPSGKGAGTGTGKGTGTGTGGLFNRLFAPGAFDKFKFGDLTNPQFNWDNGYRLQGWGKPLGKYINSINTGIQMYRGAEGLSNLADAQSEASDTASDIITASYSSPTLHYDLTSDQLELLRDLRNGGYDADVSLSNVNLLGALGSAVKGGITGFVTGGGIPGAIIGAAGGAANSGIQDLVSAQGEENAELEALYQAILDSERQYKESKKYKTYSNLGIRY